MNKTIWYVLIRKDNGYPVIIYPEKERALFVAKVNSKNDFGDDENGYIVVPVTPIIEK